MGNASFATPVLNGKIVLLLHIWRCFFGHIVFDICTISGSEELGYTDIA
jgi:hypothetical protein